MRAFFLLTVFTLAGCASLSPRECATADWFKLGEREGASGLPLTQLARHQAACVASMPDAQAYERGHAQGLARHCSPQGAFDAARRGERVAAQCEISDAVAEAQRRGAEIHAAESELLALSRLIRRVEEVQLDAALLGRPFPLLRVDLLSLRREYFELQRLIARMEDAYARGRPAPVYIPARDWRYLLSGV